MGGPTVTRRDWFRITSARPLSLHEELMRPLPPRRVVVTCLYCGAVPYYSTDWHFEERGKYLLGTCMDCFENPPALPDLGGLDLEPVGSGA